MGRDRRVCGAWPEGLPGVLWGGASDGEEPDGLRGGAPNWAGPEGPRGGASYEAGPGGG